MKTTGPSVRVRYARDGEPRLSAPDLRASGVDDLVRLADADRRPSSRSTQRGNGDGWVSADEVDAASGLHFAVVGGYHALLDRARQERPPEVPVQRLVDAFAAAAKGPVKRRRKDPPAPSPPDPVLAARRYDAQHAGATPRFLDRQVAAMEAAMGPARTEQLVTRGFALPGYGGPELVRHLYGDWRGVIASHSFTQTLRERLDRGEPFHDALARTADTIAAQVVRAVRDEGYEPWANQASRGTQIGVAEKRANGMASYLGSPATEAQLVPTALGYAHGGFLGLVHERVVAPDQPMIVLELSAAMPKGWDDAEVYIPSHVSPERVSRAYVGFSTWHDVHDYLHPPEEQQRWYALEPGARDADGRPTAMRVRSVDVARDDEYQERWVLGPVLVDAAHADAESLRAVAEAHPLLAPTLEAAQACARAVKAERAG